MSDGEDGTAKDWSYTSHVRADLRGVDLSGADLRRAIFDGADLSGADLRGASFRRANLMKAALDDSDMRNARFVKAKLSLSNMQGARMDGADLRGIRGRYAIWREANWWDATMDDSLRKALSKKWPSHNSASLALIFQYSTQTVFHPIGNWFLFGNCVHASTDRGLNRTPTQSPVLVFNHITPCD